MEKGFLGSLFDVSFSSLITTRVIKVIYILSMILIGLMALVYLIYVRVILEVIICVFRITETNVELVALQRAAAGPPTPPPPTPPAPEPPSSAPPPQPE